MQTHDSHYKRLFSHKEMVRDLLRGFVQGQWLEQADLETLELYGTDLISDQANPVQRHEDIVWRFKFGGNWVYLYLLLEFQSAPDRWMALWLLSYTALLWEKLVKTNDLAPGSKLPPILPVVLYNGEANWSFSTDLSTLCYPPPIGLERFQPQAQYLLLEQGKLAKKSVELRNLAAVLFQLEFSDSLQDFRRVLEQLSLWIETEAPKGLQRALYAFMVKWIKAKAPVDYPDEIHTFEESIPMLAKRVEQWEIRLFEEGHEKGREEGLEKGRQAGRAEGREEGLRTALHQLMQNKFGEIPAHQQNLINEADVQALDKYLSRVLQAKSVTEVLVD
ncbi:hypothetical protein AB833_13455 [Chromatiales bacterium (ex Bugula neritina AB1)]|nr:hypothetical protein AB833_13455 [Chromatiales bacterium (ex Bugula neritina AB1)]